MDINYLWLLFLAIGVSGLYSVGWLASGTATGPIPNMLDAKTAKVGDVVTVDIPMSSGTVRQFTGKVVDLDELGGAIVDVQFSASNHEDEMLDHEFSIWLLRFDKDGVCDSTFHPTKKGYVAG